MRIKKITLKNLFSFYGKQEISFKEKTIVLAENGFGKTSLLNAIKLALGQKRVKIDSILNGSASDKECFIEIDFDVFTLRRVWDFEEDFESLTIYLDDRILKNYEAEEYLKEKFPLELIDFIFFDGEVEKDLILLKSQKIKRIFEYSFDLDILSNMIIDTKKVANRLANKLGNNEISKFTDLQKNEVVLSQQIVEIEEEKTLLSKEIRSLNEFIRLNELKIRNRSKAIASIQQKIDDNEMFLAQELEIFQEINLYQLPLLLNDKLFKKVNCKNTQAIDILNKKEFEDKFHLFAQSLESSFENSELLEKFYQVFNTDSGINLTFSKKNLFDVLSSLRDAIETREKLREEFDEMKEKIIKKDNLKELKMEGVELKREKESKELAFNELSDTLDETIYKYKEIHKQLRLEFIAKREKYTQIKAIEELYNISAISQEVYSKKLEESLERFNGLLSERVKPFLEVYQHIRKIYINDKFKVVLEDEKGILLNITLLSSGQKQILSFIIISSILEFKKFVDFIFIDTPFGRLSNKSRDFIYNHYYLSFTYLTLLITTSEYDYLTKQDTHFQLYEIKKDKLGSRLEERKHD